MRISNRISERLDGKGNPLFYYMLDNGWNITILAEMSNLSFPTIRAILEGKSCQYLTVAKVCYALARKDKRKYQQLIDEYYAWWTGKQSNIKGYSYVSMQDK